MVYSNRRSRCTIEKGGERLAPLILKCLVMECENNFRHEGLYCQIIDYEQLPTIVRQASIVDNKILITTSCSKLEAKI